MHEDLSGGLAGTEQVLKFIAEEYHQALALANKYDLRRLDPGSRAARLGG